MRLHFVSRAASIVPNSCSVDMGASSTTSLLVFASQHEFTTSNTWYSVFCGNFLTLNQYTTTNHSFFKYEEIFPYFAYNFNLLYTFCMRYLGIDYGFKRIGIALSDEKGEFAIPFTVLKSSKRLVDEVLAIAEENRVGKIVVGESKDYKGQPNAIYESSIVFKKELEAEGYEVIMEPEFMTSAHAEKTQGKIELLDSSSAALILQSYLDKDSTKHDHI